MIVYTFYAVNINDFLNLNLSKSSTLYIQMIIIIFCDSRH